MPHAPDELVARFTDAACAPLDGGHASGTLADANAMLGNYPDIGSASIYAAAVLGEDRSIEKFLTADPANATRKGGPREWDALTYLCFSRYLRLDQSRSDGFVRAARLLLESGADANTGWFERKHQPKPEWESAIYGAAGVAHHPELTRLLLEHGADPNDGETPYHTPESYDNRALAVLVESGRVNADSLALMLLRKADWHDYEGIKYLLEHGADPNRRLHFGRNAIQHAMVRDNDLENIELMLRHGADPKPAMFIAARRGRSDVFELLRKRGIAVQLEGVDRLIAACAMNDADAIRAMTEEDPRLTADLLAMGSSLLAGFAGTGNASGIRQLLKLGIKIDALFTDGDGYWGVAPNSTALHVAAWRAEHEVVALLIEAGASVNALDGEGRTPLALAVRACVDSYWKERRTPKSVAVLLAAGASVSGGGLQFPSGYGEVDKLLASHGARA